MSEQTKNRPAANVVAARAVLTGTAEFLSSHSSNVELFSQYLRRNKQAELIRRDLSVPILAESVIELFSANEGDKAGLGKLVARHHNRKVQRAVRSDTKTAATGRIASANHRAAVAVVKLLPKAALLQRNQLLLVNLTRFLASEQGAHFNAAVGGLGPFRQLVDEYEELEREREQIALAKIAELHRSVRRHSVVTHQPEPEPIIDLNELVVGPAENVAIREPIEPTSHLPLTRVFRRDALVIPTDLRPRYRREDAAPIRVRIPLPGLVTIDDASRNELIGLDDLRPRWTLPERPKSGGRRPRSQETDRNLPSRDAGGLGLERKFGPEHGS